VRVVFPANVLTSKSKHKKVQLSNSLLLRDSVRKRGGSYIFRMPYENIYRSRKTANELVNELVTCQQYNLSVTLTTVALAAMRMLR